MSDVRYPQVRVQYGFEKVPVETVFDIAMHWRVEQVRLRLRWMVERVSSEIPAVTPEADPPAPERKCPKCGATLRGEAESGRSRWKDWALNVARCRSLLGLQWLRLSPEIRRSSKVQALLDVLRAQGKNRKV